MRLARETLNIVLARLPGCLAPAGVETTKNRSKITRFQGLATAHSSSRYGAAASILCGPFALEACSLDAAIDGDIGIAGHAVKRALVQALDSSLGQRTLALHWHWALALGIGTGHWHWALALGIGTGPCEMALTLEPPALKARSATGQMSGPPSVQDRWGEEYTSLNFQPRRGKENIGRMSMAARAMPEFDIHEGILLPHLDICPAASAVELFEPVSRKRSGRPL